jgi:serine/threonine protein kinase
MGPVALAVTIATTVAQVGFLLRLRQAHRQGGPKPPSLIYGIALAWPATVLLGLPDVLAWLGQGDPTGGVQTACLGIMWISFYQSLSLSREHLVSLKRADELNRELEERVRAIQTKHREVELLNDELRRQIAARSRELAEKLAQMDDDVLEAPPLLEEGTVVESRYRIIKELGSGGMGTVYEVERITDGNHFALKALGAGGDSQARARFAREAQIVANVNHPNVVSIVDVDVAQSGFLFLVMELVAAGTTLHDVRRRHRDIPWTMGILAQVAEGLCAIHEAGIIHRDLKPGNILLSRGDDGRKPLVKITDFGISRLAVDGARVSLRERTAVKRTVDELPDARDALDPFGPAAIDAAITAHFARTAADAKTRRALPGNAPAMPHEERDSGLVTSARTDLLLHPASDDAGAFAATTLDVAKTTPTTPATPTADTAIEQASPAIHKVLPDEAKAKAAPAADAAPTANEQPVIQREGVTPAHAGLPRGVTPQSPLTEPGLIFGTPQYMAQELTSGTNQATRASDVFSLGIIAFEVLTGRRPFAEAPVSAKLSGKPLPVAVPFRAVCPTLPAAIAELLDRAMDHDPLARPTSRELAIQLRAIASRGAA